MLLYAARFLAIVAVASTGAALIIRTLGREIKLLLTVRNGNHVVVCGLGPVGSELAAQMIADKHEVVVIDRGDDAALVNGALESGAQRDYWRSCRPQVSSAGPGPHRQSFCLPPRSTTQ